QVDGLGSPTDTPTHAMTSSPASRSAPPRPPSRTLAPWKLALFAVATTVLLLAGLELVLRTAGIQGAPDRTTTWFADHILNPPFVNQQALFTPRVDYVQAGQSHHFHPFSPDRAENTFRVAVFGGSAAHGYGVLEPAAFPHRVEQLLQQAVPNVEIQVINFGTVAWSSQQILWAARQIWDLSTWDLILVYSGHNELLELSSWKTYMEPAEHRRYTRALLLNQRLEGLRTFQVARRLLGRDAEEQAKDAVELRGGAMGDNSAPDTGDGDQATDNNLQAGRDPIGKVPARNLDDMQAVPAENRARIGQLERDYAARTYSHNIGKVIELANARGTPVVLLSPAPNDFQDPISFPVKGPDGARLQDLLSQSDGLMNSSDWDGLEARAREALDIAPDPAAMYMLAQAFHYRGKMGDALHWYTQARRHTEYPNRIVPEVRDAILDFEGQPGVLGVLDIEARFRARHEDGFIEYQLVYDHCHPSIEGNFVIAGEVVRLLLDSGLEKLSRLKRVNIDQWVDTGRARVSTQNSPDPRLWEWDGRDYASDQATYIADFQGDWLMIRESQEARISSPEATAMDWLWAGNGRFYGYEVQTALQAWSRAIELEPTLCLAWANKSHALRLVGDRAGGLKAAEKAQACEPDNKEFSDHKALLEALMTEADQ
ncbi:MAG TPA: hypothetical protein DIU15_02260, partial [Deltaproteobacteria bacterium]|nr:hypothetical protein [Deltaproteobacteria bacterium]